MTERTNEKIRVGITGLMTEGIPGEICVGTGGGNTEGIFEVIHVEI